MTVLGRDAEEPDIEAVTQLVNAWIPTHTITWTDVLETRRGRLTWFKRQRRHGFPVLVAETDRAVVGFATFESFRGEGKWPGYAHTAELSIHIREDHWGQGVGRALINALVVRAQDADIHVLVSAIDSENEASIRFHAALGFVEVARMPETGRKFGRWLDLVLMQRIIDSQPRQ